MRKDLTGRKFSRLTVHSYAETRGKRAFWNCVCECGVTKVVGASELTGEKTKSCGCLNIEKIIERNTKHGHYTRKNKTAEYRAWAMMKSRCYNKNLSQYKDWGGRGITICDSWHSFENFLKDMGEKPSSAHSLDRINNDLPYNKDNCRWATSREQNRNKRTNIEVINIDTGVRYGTIVEAAESAGISREVLAARLSRGKGGEFSYA